MTTPVPLAALLAALAFAAPAAAQVFSPAPILACLQAGGGIACAGGSIEPCRAASPGGGSNAGLSGCIDAEYRWWEAQMNSVYAQLLALRQQEAAMMRAQGLGSFGTPEAVQALQLAWTGWRDAVCGYEVTLWQGGSGGGPAGANCMMQATAQQALTLDGYLREARQ